MQKTLTCHLFLTLYSMGFYIQCLSSNRGRSLSFGIWLLKFDTLPNVLSTGSTIHMTSKTINIRIACKDVSLKMTPFSFTLICKCDWLPHQSRTLFTISKTKYKSNHKGVVTNGVRITFVKLYVFFGYFMFFVVCVRFRSLAFIVSFWFPLNLGSLDYFFHN